MIKGLNYFNLSSKENRLMDGLTILYTKRNPKKLKNPQTADYKFDAYNDTERIYKKYLEAFKLEENNHMPIYINYNLEEGKTIIEGLLTYYKYYLPNSSRNPLELWELYQEAGFYKMTELQVDKVLQILKRERKIEIDKKSVTILDYPIIQI